MSNEIEKLQNRKAIENFMKDNETWWVPPDTLKEFLDDSVLKRSAARNPNLPLSIMQQLYEGDELKLQLAENPGTPFYILNGFLLFDQDVEVRKKIVSGKNIPTHLIGFVVDDWYTGVRGSAASNTNAPLSVLKKLAKDSDASVRIEVAKNPTTPLAILEDLSRDSDADVVEAVAENPNASADLKMALFDSLKKNREAKIASTISKIQYSDTKARERIAESSEYPEVLDVLANDAEESVIREVAKNKHASQETLIRLHDVRTEGGIFAGGQPVYGEELGSNPSTPPDVLAEIADSYLSELQIAVAGNESAPITALEKLGHKWSDESVKAAVARNAFTPVNVLAELAQDRSVEVKTAVAKNASTPVNVLAELAKDPSFDVKTAVADNKATTADILQLLAGDPELVANDSNKKLAHALILKKKLPIETRMSLFNLLDGEVALQALELAGDLDTPPELLRKIGSSYHGHVFHDDVMMLVAANPSTPSDVLEKLAHNPSNTYVSIVAMNPSAPASLLSGIYKNFKGSPISALSINPSTPPEILESLAVESMAEDGDKDICWNIVGNPSTPGSVIEMIYRQKETNPIDVAGENNNRSNEDEIAPSFVWRIIKHPNLPDSVYEEILHRHSVFMGMQLASQDSTSESLLKQLAKEDDADVRWFVALNPSTSDDVLEELSNDQEEAIASHARNRLHPVVENELPNNSGNASALNASSGQAAPSVQSGPSVQQATTAQAASYAPPTQAPVASQTPISPNAAQSNSPTSANVQNPYAGQGQTPQTSFDNAGATSDADKDKTLWLTIGLGILSFLLPLVGLILYFVWRKSNPDRSNTILGFAAFGFLFSLGVSFFT